MTKIDPRTLKPGDVFLARHEVTVNPVTGQAVVIGREVAPPEYFDIVSVEPRPIKVGNKVIWGVVESAWTVLAIHEDEAWLWMGASKVTAHLSDLRHADEEAGR